MDKVKYQTSITHPVLNLIYSFVKVYKREIKKNPTYKQKTKQHRKKVKKNNNKKNKTKQNKSKRMSIVLIMEWQKTG